MTFTEEKAYKLRDELRKYNPLIGLPETVYLFLDTAHMTHLDDRAVWAKKDIRDQVDYCLSRTGCAGISGLGLKQQERFVGENIVDSPKGCFWSAFSEEFLLPLNNLSQEEFKRFNIYDFAKRLDVPNKSKIIADASNNGTYFWIPDKSGEKTIDEACSLVVPLKKECLPECSLKKICGKDYRVQVATPKQLSERVLIPLIDKSWGPIPKEKWDEMKDCAKEAGIARLKEFGEKINGKPREIFYRT